MSIQVIHPKDEQEWLELRCKDITSTDVAALFGISPYLTPFELWHRKKSGVVVKLEENKRMKWGTALQDAIAGQIAKEQGWTIRRMDEYMRDPELRVGSSFDFSIEGYNKGLLEIKNVDYMVFKEDWPIDDKGNIQAPLHIEIQVQHQLLVSGREFAYIGVLVAGNDDYLIKRTRDEAVISAIKTKVAEFWKSIEENNPPPVNFEADREFLGKLFNIATPGKVLNVVQDPELTKLAVEYRDLGEQMKSMTARREAIKAQFLATVEDAEKVIGDGFTIDAGITGPCHMDYDRPGFRRFTIRFKKEKKG